MKDEKADVRRSVAIAMGKIATVLQKEKDTTAIPELEMALAALRATHFPGNTTRVHQAIEALKAIEKSR